MKDKHTKKLFEKLPDEKKERIVRAAIAEFARTGIRGCNVRDIAKRAGISHGSLFHYFPSKDDMIHTIIQEGYKKQRDFFLRDVKGHGDVYEKMEAILFSCLELSRKQSELISLWLELSLPYHESFSEHTLHVEEDGISFVKELLRQGVAEGSIRKDIDVDVAAYIVDSLFANLLKSQASNIERTKYAQHFDSSEDDRDVVRKIIVNLKRLLRTPETTHRAQ